MRGMAAQTITDVGKVIQGVLRHDKKLNTFKIALIPSLNDTALNFAALHGRGHGIRGHLEIRRSSMRMQAS